MNVSSSGDSSDCSENDGNFIPHQGSSGHFATFAMKQSSLLQSNVFSKESSAKHSKKNYKRKHQSSPHKSSKSTKKYKRSSTSPNVPTQSHPKEIDTMEFAEKTIATLSPNETATSSIAEIASYVLQKYIVSVYEVYHEL